MHSSKGSKGGYGMQSTGAQKWNGGGGECPEAGKSPQSCIRLQRSWSCICTKGDKEQWAESDEDAGGLLVETTSRIPQSGSHPHGETKGGMPRCILAQTSLTAFRAIQDALWMHLWAVAAGRRSGSVYSPSLRWMPCSNPTSADPVTQRPKSNCSAPQDQCPTH